MRTRIGESYGEVVKTLREFELGAGDVPAYLLNGHAAAELRRLLPRDDRRKLGAFFTPQVMADRLAEPLGELDGAVHVADLSCGAGDLLLAALRRLAPSVRAGATEVSLLGVDCVEEFAEAASLRLQLLASYLGIDANIETQAGDGMRATIPAGCSAVILNPPFVAVEAPAGCEWGSGVVNGAGVFLDAVLDALPAGTLVLAILPEVLRSGSRYRRWRAAVDARLEVTSNESLGRFDDFADVDVFALRGVRREDRQARSSGEWVGPSDGPTVSDFFNISVGPVVQYRDPAKGPWHPFLTAKGFPAWSTVKVAPKKRRFIGRLHAPPFVIIPRTSRPGEPERARAAVVRINEPVAVENHLLVASPISGGQAACEELLEVLRRPSTTTWLDQSMRCRHLTVGAIGQIPWETAT